MFQDPWDNFAVNPKIQVETIPNSYARLLDENTSAVDGIIDRFLADTMRPDVARSH